jgi:sirohydrochlorin ferrochelatase
MLRFTVLVAVLLSSACASSSGSVQPSTSPAANRVGVLVMAHGASPEWNASVDEGLASLREEIPTVIAFGMADPTTLRAGLDSLAAAGVRRVAVVRMFLSGSSFLDQTRYLLGLSDARPHHFVGDLGTEDTEPTPVPHDLSLVTHEAGIVSSPRVAKILRDRVDALSIDPSSESVLIVAHGMRGESENDALLRAMHHAAEGVREMGFRYVGTETLREDWKDERVAASRRIRAFVERESAEGRRVLVVPLRLSGFGPYADVLENLSYSAGKSLLPHPEIDAWVRETAARIFCDRAWTNPLEACGVMTGG